MLMPRIRARRRARRPGGEINMTPILDMTFLLLIAFIITFPALQSGIDVRLPTAGKGDSLKADEPTVVTVNADGRIFIGKDEVTDEELSERLTAIVKANPEAVAHIRGDETQSYGRIMDVIKILHAARLTRFSLVTKTE